MKLMIERNIVISNPETRDFLADSFYIESTEPLPIVFSAHIAPAKSVHLKMTREESLKNLMQIPGVGKSIANDLYLINIQKVEDQKGKNPQMLYEMSNAMAGTVQDRCLLYVFRGAVYFAETPPEKRLHEKLKWWNWKD